MWLPLMHPLLGTWPRTQACALTGNRTGNPLVPRLALNPLSHTSQGNINSLPSLCDHPPEATKAITTRSTWDPTLALPGQPAASLIPAGLFPCCHLTQGALTTRVMLSRKLELCSFHVSSSKHSTDPPPQFSEYLTAAQRKYGLILGEGERYSGPECAPSVVSKYRGAEGHVLGGGL